MEANALKERIVAEVCPVKVDLGTKYGSSEKRGASYFHSGANEIFPENTSIRRELSSYLDGTKNCLHSERTLLEPEVAFDSCPIEMYLGIIVIALEDCPFEIRDASYVEVVEYRLSCKDWRWQVATWISPKQG